MVTATYDGLSRRGQLFVDGAPDNAMTFPGLTHSQTPPSIAKASWSENYFLPGAIDEVRIESGVRTEAEVEKDFQFFNRPLPQTRLAVRALWSFEPPARGLDLSGYGRHASALAGTSTSGVSGAALALNGSTDVVFVPGHEQMSPNDFTIAFWARLHSLPGAGGAALVSNLDSRSGWESAVDAQGRLQLTLASTPGGPKTVQTSQVIPVGAWKRIVISYRSWSRHALLYVDGELISQQWFAEGFTPRAQGLLTVGRAAVAAERFADAEIDELTVLAHPWDGAEAAADFYAWSPPEPSPAEEPHAPPPTSRSLISQWELDETETGAGVSLLDGVGQSHISTAGDRSRPLQGLSGAARYFGGWPDYASIPSSPKRHTDSFSYSTWIRINETPDSWGAIFSTVDPTHTGWMAGVYKDGRVIFSVAGPPDSLPWLLSSQPLRLGRWQHLAVTFDGPTRRAVIYIDGERSAGAVFPAWQPSSGIAPTIGRASWAETGFLKFSADRMRLYDHERSGVEVAEEFAELAGHRRPDPIGRWEMEQDLTDAGPGERDGNLAGSEVIPGRYGNALQFRGPPDSGTFSPSGVWSASTFTYSAWIRLDALPNSWGTLFSTLDGDYRGWYVGVHHDGRVIFCVAGRPSSSPWLLSSAVLTPGRWTHVAVTFDAVSRQASVYIDGSLEADAVVPAFTPSSGVGPTLARASWTNNYYLQVAVDRMRLEPVALSVQEILQGVME